MLPALLCLLALASPSSCQRRSSGSAGFDRCEQLAARQPESEETARCFDETGAALNSGKGKATKLQELLAAASGKPLAHVLS